MEEGTSQAKHPPPPKVQTQAQGTSQGQGQPQMTQGQTQAQGTSQGQGQPPTIQGQTAAQGQNKPQGLATTQGTAKAQGHITSQGHAQGHQGHAQGHAHGDVESIHNMQEVSGLSDGGWLCCLPCAWLRRNTSVHKASLSFAMLLVMSLLVASPVLFLMSSAPSGFKNMPCKNKDDGSMCKVKVSTCASTACKDAAVRIESSLSWKNDPCKDFYQFACGGWGRHHGLTAWQYHVDNEIKHLLEERTRTGIFKKLGDFYRSCISAGDRTIVTPMFSLLDDLGGYLPPDSTGTVNLGALIARILRVNGAPLFDLYIDRDLQNNSRLAIFLDLPRRYEHNIRLLRHPLDFEQVLLRLPEWSGFRKRHKRKADESRAYSHLKDISEQKRLKMMEYLLNAFLPATMPSEHQRKEAHNILLLASMLTKLYPRAKEMVHRLQLKDSYIMSNVPELQGLYDFVQWKPLLQEVFDTKVFPDDTVYVMAPTYMAGLARTMAHFQPRIIHNAVLLVFATDILNELVNSTVSDGDRTAFCMRVSINVMSQPVSALYVTQYTPQYLHHLSVKVRDMFNKLRRTLEDRIKTAPWLDDMSRTAALNKVTALRGHFLTWPQLWNQTFLETLMEQVEVTEGDFFQNVITRYRQIRTPPGDFHKEKPSDKKWAFPFVVNAFYDTTLNSIVIPLAVLTQPYLNSEVPLYVPYSTMGLVFAHEMLHGFDLTGVEYDATGQRNSWMTPEAKLRLEARLECVAKQYRAAFKHQVQFKGDTVDVQFDFNITRNEDMADVCGMQVAYETWRNLHDKMADFRLPRLSGLSPNQLFFLQIGQLYCSDMDPEDYIIVVERDFHSPPPERVNGVMMNFPAFAEAFSCAPGSRMNPFRKCSIY